MSEDGHSGKISSSGIGLSADVSCWKDMSCLGVFSRPKYTVSSSTIANDVYRNSPVLSSNSSDTRAISCQLLTCGAMVKVAVSLKNNAIGAQSSSLIKGGMILRRSLRGSTKEFCRPHFVKFGCA